MHEIFISYRRVDTEASAGHLYENLCAAYGEQAVFMDTRANNIPWGSDWQARLEAALQGCQVLVALIGPLWLSCERAPGQRRLDVEDDWVRNEIITALRRGVRVLPVLLQGAQPAPEDKLPPALLQAGIGLNHCQAAPVTEGKLWPVQLKWLLDAIDETPALAQLHELLTAETGFRRVREVMGRNPAASRAVGGSHHAIATADREIDEIRLLKGIHDALHEVEGQCLIPLRGQPPESLRAVHAMKFVQKLREARRLRFELASLGCAIPSALEYDFESNSRSALSALHCAWVARTDERHAMLVGALEVLLGQLPMRLNDAIAFSAKLIELKDLKHLMQDLVDLVGPGRVDDAEFRELSEGVQALDYLAADLKVRVLEHGWLQSLDNMLRNLVGGAMRPGTGASMDAQTLASGWKNILRLRDRFKQARTLRVRDGDKLLKSQEGAITEAVQACQAQRAGELLADYANEAGEIFRKVDAELKDFSNALRERSTDLKMLLRMSQPEGQAP